MANIEEKVLNLISSTVQDLGYILYDVEYVKEGKDYYLRIYIDNNKGISIEDCEKVSTPISDILDENDLIKDQYFLEVSSCGLERILKKDNHLQSNIGKEVEVKLYKPLEEKKIYTGILKSFDKDTIVIDSMYIDRKVISQIKTIYNWENI